MDYQLIAIDIDGTLLNSRNELTPAVLQAVRCAHQRCACMVLISGRNLLGVRHVLDQLGLDLWVIGSGGAYVGNPRSRQVLLQTTMTIADARVVIHHARQAGAGIFLEKPGQLYWEGPLSMLDELVSIIDIQVARLADIEQILDGAPLKITLIHDNPVLREIEQALRPQAPSLNLTYSMPIYLEITRNGVNKGIALRCLAEHLQVPLERVAAVGNGENDIPMFREAGLSIAMGNSPLIVRQAADRVAPSNDEEGLVWALAQIEVARVSGS